MADALDLGSSIARYGGSTPPPRTRYTKTGLVFGFSKNQSLVAVIPGLENAEDTYSDNSFRIFSESYFEMSIKIYCKSLLVNYT